MSVIGESEKWQDALISAYEQVREAVLRHWPYCQKRIHTDTNELRENPINRLLVWHLQRDPELRMRFIINSQPELLPDEIDNDLHPVGVQDIAIQFFIFSDQLLLGIECKRLNVTTAHGRKPQADRYVKQGMLRFVKGQYSADLPVAGMIGYVMDGDIAGAHKSVIAEISKSAAALRCDPTSIAILNHPDYFSTRHARDTVPIELRHMLLAA